MRDDTYGFAITPEIKLYLEKNAPTGIYLRFAPRYRHLILSEEVPSNSSLSTVTMRKSSSDMLGSGFLFGVQRIYANRLTLDFFLGTSFNINVGSNKNTFNNAELRSSTGFRIGLYLGYLF